MNAESVLGIDLMCVRKGARVMNQQGTCTQRALPSLSCFGPSAVEIVNELFQKVVVYNG